MFSLPLIMAFRAISTCVKLCNTLMRSEFLHTCNSERQILLIGFRDRISGRVAATRCQKLTGGMPPLPPALTKALNEVCTIQPNNSNGVRMARDQGSEILNLQF